MGIVCGSRSHLEEDSIANVCNNSLLFTIAIDQPNTYHDVYYISWWLYVFYLLYCSPLHCHSIFKLYISTQYMFINFFSNTFIIYLSIHLSYL